MKLHVFPILILAGMPSALLGQAKSSAVEVKRLPTRKALPPEAVPSPDKYPFGQIVTTLQQGDLHSGASTKAVGQTSANSGSPAVGDLSPAKDIVLSPTAKEALNVSQTWMMERHTPAPGKDGRVLYTFGAGLPTVVCAPLRVCVVEMEPGEKLVGEPHIGDSVRWLIAPATVGTPDLTTAMIVIKPQMAGLDTNLLVTTDRRAYYLRLISKPEEYLARVAFAYPESEILKWKAHLMQGEQQRKEQMEASRIAPIGSIEELYFDYRIQGGDENVRPVRVVDDGKKTFIQMTPNSAHREAPVLVVLGPSGPEMVNYRVKGDMYIVDRLFERGALILGVGKKARRAEIIRGTYHGKAAKGDPYTDFRQNQGEKKQ